MKLLLVAMLLFVLAISPLLFTAQPAAAATPAVVYVSPTGSDTAGNGSLMSPFSTISRGVAAAPAGSTVLVAPGTYDEMVNITQQITLQSQSSDPSNTIIDAAGLSMGIMVRGADASGTIIQGFTVKNADNHGIYAQDTSKVTIENNFVTHNGVNPNKAFSGEDKAVELVGTTYSVIAGNTVVGNMYGGIAINDNGPINPGFYSPGTLNAATGNVVSGNTVVANKPHHCAIVVSAYNQGAGVINNIVSNNIVVDDQSGIIVAANTPNTQAVNNSVIYNTILNNGEGGVVIHANALGTIVSGTVVMGNTFSGNGGPDSSPATGQVLIPKFPGIIVGGEDPKIPVLKTTIAQNVFHNEYYGIYVVNGTETTILSNTADSTVSVFVSGAAVSQDTLGSQISSLSSTITSLQNSLDQLKSSAVSRNDLSALTNTVNSLSGTLNQLQSSAAKASDLSAASSTLKDLSSTVNTLQSSAVKQSDLDALSGSVSTASYVAYAALVIAVVLGVTALALSRRRPSPK